MLFGTCSGAPGSGAGADAAVIGAGGRPAGGEVVGVACPGGGVGALAGMPASAVHPKRDASSVARSPPARCQPTTASTRSLGTASPYSTAGSSASTEAAIPTLRSWSAAVLATATDVGSLVATPITIDSGTPSLLIRPRVDSGAPGALVGDPAAGAGVGDVVVFVSISYPACLSSARAASFVNAGGAVGT